MMELPGEWAVEVARRGVDPSEIYERWGVIDRFHDAQDGLGEAAGDLRVALYLAIEGTESRDRTAAARAAFDQALAEFGDTAREAQRYVGGA